MKNSVSFFLSCISIIGGLFLLFVVLPAYFKTSVFCQFSDFFSIDRIEIERIGDATLLTFFRFLVSIVLGYLIGIVLSLPCIYSSFLDSILSPWYNIFRITPTIVWIPVLMNLKIIGSNAIIPIILGTIFSSLYVSFFICKVVRDIPDEEKMAMKAMKVDFYWKIWNCYFPRIIVSSVASLKLGGSVAFILVIVGESLLSLDTGLGHLLDSYQGTLNRPAFWMTAIIISLLALMIFSFCNLLNNLTRTNEKR